MENGTLDPDCARLLTFALSDYLFAPDSGTNNGCTTTIGSPQSFQSRGYARSTSTDRFASDAKTQSRQGC